MKEEGFAPPSSREDEEYGGQIHLIPNVQFSGDIESDLAPLPPEILDWMWGELDSGDSIEDEFGREYAGSDVQDVLKVLDWQERGSDEGMYEDLSKDQLDLLAKALSEGGCGGGDMGATLKIDNEDGDEPNDSPGDGLEPVKEMYDDDDPYAEEDPYMSGLEMEFPWMKDKPKRGRKGKGAMPDEEAAIAAAMADAADEYAVPPEEEEEDEFADPLQEWWDIRNDERAKKFFNWAIPKNK